MPIYEYRCTKCDHVIEKILQKSEAEDCGDTIVEPCPQCKNGTFQKVMSVPGPSWDNPETG